MKPAILLGQSLSLDQGPKVLKVLLQLFEGLQGTWQLVIMSSVVILMVAIKNLMSYLNIYFASKIKRKISLDLRKKASKIILEPDLYYFNNLKQGEVLNISSAEVERSVEILTASISLITTTSTIAIFLGLLVLISLKLTLALLFLFPISWFMNQNIVRRNKQLSVELTRYGSAATGKLYELLNGSRLVRSSCMEEQEFQSLAQILKQREQSMLALDKNLAIFAPISETTNLIFLFILIWVSKFLMVGDADVITTTLLSYLAILFRLLPLIGQLNRDRSSFAQALSPLNVVMEFLDRSTKPFTTSGDRLLSSIQDGIAFKQVSFIYPGSDELVLKDINLFVPKGTTLALVGPSGSGKSTLGDLLPRFYHPSAGKIEIDGIPIEEFDLSSLRRSIGIVSQDTFVFNASIRDNITYGQSLRSEEELIQAAKVANAYDFIQELPDKFDTMIGNRGVRLSGGQRQRLAIARAIIQDPKILILDEATSALDTVSERLVQAAIDELSSNRTTIVIAHRLSTIKNAEQIAVLSQGTVVELGSHDDLLARGGLYAKLYQNQSILPDVEEMDRLPTSGEET